MNKKTSQTKTKRVLLQSFSVISPVKVRRKHPEDALDTEVETSTAELTNGHIKVPAPASPILNARTSQT